MIEFRDITKTYKMGKMSYEALKGVSLSINDGEYVAIIGPSGSGKSTLLHVMGLLHKHTSGDYFLNRENINNFSDKDLSLIRTSLIGFVFQQFHLLPKLSAYENVALPLMYSGHLENKENAKNRLFDVSLGTKIYNKPNEVSGGEQQRMAIARSLINNPEIILADEPTGNLDSKNKVEIMNLLEKLHKKGNTLVVITHEKEIADRADRLIKVEDGLIVMDKNIKKTSVPLQNSYKKISEIVENRNYKKGKNRIFTIFEKFINYNTQAVMTLFQNKIRSFLSMLGILIGVAAVIAMLALGEGAKTSMKESLKGLGSNLVMVRPGPRRTGGASLAIGIGSRFDFRDVDSLRKIKGIKNISPTINGNCQIVYENNNSNTRIEGVGSEYPIMHSLIPKYGRFFNEEEVVNREKVAVIGTTVLRNLFSNQNPIGKTIKINKINFKVIGIFPKKGSTGFRDQDDTVYIPISSAMYRLLGDKYFNTIELEIENQSEYERIEQNVRKVLYKNHKINELDYDAIRIQNMQEIQDTMSKMTNTMTMLLGFISGLSLLVGGIGIMNIMLVSVTERTKEIGLRKAIGANNEDIMTQFLIESIILSFCGGIIGIMLGICSAYILGIISKWAIKITLRSIMLSSSFSIFVGVCFGIWPAKIASKLDPIEALRYE